MCEKLRHHSWDWKIGELENWRWKRRVEKYAVEVTVWLNQLPCWAAYRPMDTVNLKAQIRNEIMSFTDNLLALFKKPEVQSGLSLAATGATLPTPTFSAVLSAVKEGVNLIDQIRLNYIIQGLASGLNQETMLNELTNYVSASEDNAYHVANTLRKALFTESRKGCILLGRILADHIGKNERYDRDDIIIAHAIESATDEDLVNFREMMKKYSGGDIEIIDQTTVDWCYSNRLFVMRIVEYQKFETEARKLNKASFDVACRVLEALEMNIADYFHGKYAVGEEVFFDQDGKERYVATGRLTSEDVTGD